MNNCLCISVCGVCTYGPAVAVSADVIHWELSFLHILPEMMVTKKRNSSGMATMEVQEQAFYLEKHELAVDSDSEFAYEEVPVEEDYTSVVEEDLDTALRVINEAQGDAEAAAVCHVIINVTLSYHSVLKMFLFSLTLKLLMHLHSA